MHMLHLLAAWPATHPAWPGLPPAVSPAQGWGMLAQPCSTATAIVIIFMLTSLLEKGKYERGSGHGNGGGEDFPLLPPLDLP